MLLFQNLLTLFKIFILHNFRPLQNNTLFYLKKLYIYHFCIVIILKLLLI